MRKILASRNFSLACALLNGYFCLNAISHGNLIMAGVCGVFCFLCTKNYVE